MIVPGMFVCSRFLISVCMFIVSKALLISSATVIVRAGGAIWLNPFATVLFSVCSAVTVECCVLYPCCMGVFGMFAVMYGRRLFSSVFAIIERRDMGLYEVPLFVSLLGFWDMDYVSQLPCVRYYVFVKSSFKHTREECESQRAYVF